MSLGLMNQIQAYTADMDAEQMPVTADEVALRIETVRELPVERSQPLLPRRAWVATAAAVAVVALVAVPLLLSRAESSPPPATEPVQEASSSTTTPPATVPVVVPERQTGEPPYVGNETFLGTISWSELEGDSAGIPSVNADIDGYVISGLDDQMLFSSDGISWSPVPSDTGLDGYRVFQSLGEWAVAGQSMWRETGITRDLLRSNGEIWIKVESSEPWPELSFTSPGAIAFPISGRLDDSQVVRTDFGYLAYAGYHPDDGPHYTRLWISNDGSIWEEIQPVQEPDGASIGGMSIGSVGNLIYVGIGGETGAVIRIGYIDIP